MAIMSMTHDVDPRDDLLTALGNTSEIEIFNNQVLVAIYVRPPMTRGGIILPDKTRDEDRFQGKAGLVVKMGPQAFVETPNWKFDSPAALGDWVIFRPSDGWGITFPSARPTDREGVLCRVLDDIHIRGRIQHPDQVW